ncbi:MAG: SRPBCC family protein [Pseudomonadota bacterium]
MERHQTNDGFVRKALLTNAVFSAVAGLICIAAPSLLATTLLTGGFVFERIQGPLMILDLGIALLLFAGLTFYAARKRHLSLTLIRVISAADLAWVALSLALLIIAPAAFTTFGMVLVGAIAIVTLILGVEQLIGAAVTYQGHSKIAVDHQNGVMTLSASLPSTATPRRAWQVISNMEAYADVADNLSRVEVVNGAGEGMVRQCADKKGRTWHETCTRWDDGKGFAFSVHTDAPDYPYPIASLTGEWWVEPTDTGATVGMLFKVQPRGGPLNRLAFKMMVGPFAKTCDSLLMRWVAIMEERSSSRRVAKAVPVLKPSSSSA